MLLISAIGLRERYAMSGTDIVHAARSRAREEHICHRGKASVLSPYVCAMRCAVLTYVCAMRCAVLTYVCAMRCAVLTYVCAMRRVVLTYVCAMRCAVLTYVCAMRCAVLTYAMLVPGGGNMGREGARKAG
eukprot:148310-Rhodomonas_salina.5